MDSVKIAYVQWPDGLLPYGQAWDRIADDIDSARPDILVTNEMPFGHWLPERSTYDAQLGERWAALHEDGLTSLSKLNVRAIVSSRPVVSKRRLANEAFVLENDYYCFIHHKKYFPQEEGFYEVEWFDGGRDGFDCVQIGGVRIGVLLCTELFFNEHAREYGRCGADVIVTPRSSGRVIDQWATAGKMAAIVGGAYFVSSNRVGGGALGQEFGGAGFSVDLQGETGQITNEESPVSTTVVSLNASAQKKKEYPCYVRGAS